MQLGENKIASFDAVIGPLSRLPSLSVLYLEHNPLASDFEYRLRLAKGIPQLTQIDATAVVRRG